MSYVYYSYEEWGRGYIGSRSQDPEGDDYMGSFTDPTFQPTHKIVLAEFDDYKDALAVEIELHEFYDVARNPHFANRCRATSTGFSRQGVECSDETRRLMSENNYSRTEEAKERKRGDNNPMRRPEVAAKCKGNKSRTGMTNTLESNQRRSETLKGRQFKEETLDRMAKSATGRFLITDGETRKWCRGEVPEGWRRSSRVR